jgi:predicted PurR-regulated permease PerM
MHFMLGAFLGAVTLYVVCRQLIFYLVIQKKWPRWLVAVVVMVLSLVVIVLPFAWLISVLINKVEPLITDKTKITGMIGQIDAYVKGRFNLNLFSEKNLEKVIGTVTGWVPKFLGSSVSTVTNVGISYFIVYFMIVKCSEMELWVRRNMPLHSRNSSKLVGEIRESIKANAIGIPVLCILQGIVATIGYLIFGIKDAFLWGIITGLCSVVPVAGSLIVWLPTTLYLFATGHQNQGIGLLLYCLIVLGSTDNVFRFMLQKRLADVHPLITLFGVIIGVNLFGVLGLIFGPLLLSLFTSIVKIYADEFGEDKMEE